MSSRATDGVVQVDFYALLGLPLEATLAEVKKAYRTTALKYHPDKNPDNKDAAEKFHLLQLANDTLCDPVKRSAYDQQFKAAIERKKRQQQLDSKRRHYADDLTQREDNATSFKRQKELDEARKKEEVGCMTYLDQKASLKFNRLREEGLRWQAELSSQIHESLEHARHAVAAQRSSQAVDPSSWALVIKWKKKKYDFDQTSLREIFSVNGAIDTILVSGKTSSAILQYKTKTSAENVMKLASTKSPELDRFRIGWASGKAPSGEEDRGNLQQDKSGQTGSEGTMPPTNPSTSVHTPPSASFDYEALTFQRMNEAAQNLDREQKRKRALEELMQQKNDDCI